MVCTLVMAGLVSPFFLASMRLHTQRNAIESIVRQANLVDRDPISVALLERGEVVTLAEGKFESSRLRSIGVQLFDRQGKVLDPTLVSDILLAPYFPAWSPVFVVERYTSPLFIGAILLCALYVSLWLELFLPCLCLMGMAAAIVVPAMNWGYFALAFVTTGTTALIMSFALLIRICIAVLNVDRKYFLMIILQDLSSNRQSASSRDNQELQWFSILIAFIRSLPDSLKRGGRH